MPSLSWIPFALLATVPLAAAAADAPPPAAAAVQTEAHQFDFLLGEWRIDVHPKVSSLAAMIHGTPRLTGTWKAWRAADGAIEDDMRIVDASGNPISSRHSRRTWDAAAGRWTISGTDVLRKRDSTSTARWENGEMHLDGKFTDADGDTTLLRVRYGDIAADAFRLRENRSSDDGKTWEEDTLVIEAKRTAPAP